MTQGGTGISVRTGTFVSASPIVTSLLLAGAGVIVVQSISSDTSINTSAIYSGVFDLLSIFTGFLVTFYVFVVTKGNDFLEKIKTTATYKMVLTLLKFTILWSTAMIIFSYILMVTDPKGFDLLSANGLFVFFWLANVFLIGVNFSRCVSHFLTIVEAGAQ